MSKNPQKLYAIAEPYYPESDGKPMADNTIQFNEIVKVKTNLDILFEDQEVFVAGDLFWYPVEGMPTIVVAPDVMVAFDRPQEHRTSYKQWLEGNKPPEVVFEILSEGNTVREMKKKLAFYEEYDVQEYYLIDPYDNSFIVYLRTEEKLLQVERHPQNIWKSPLLQITIEADTELAYYFPDGQPFRMPTEMNQQLVKERMEKNRAIQEKEQERLLKEQALAEKEEALSQAEQERLEKEKMASELERLRKELEQPRN